MDGGLRGKSLRFFEGFEAVAMDVPVIAGKKEWGREEILPILPTPGRKEESKNAEPGRPLPDRAGQP